MSRLSVVIIAKNEEANIKRCLEAVQWADEVVVVDSGSTDRTQEIAKERGATVYSITWQGFGAAKKAGVALATGDWVLSLDADEVVTSELAREIREVVSQDGHIRGFHLRRRTNFLGKWVLDRGWYHEYVLRLFRRGYGNFDDSIVHESLAVEGETKRLQGVILHYSYPTLEQYFQKQNRYTTLGAEAAVDKGRRASFLDMSVRPMATFLKCYFNRQGFLDGWEGLLFSWLSAVMVGVKYAKVRQLVRERDEHSR